MRKNTAMSILGLLFLIVLGNSIFYFVVPYENDTMILEGDDFGIVDNLKAPFHASFISRSDNQSIELSLLCSEGSVDIIVLESSQFFNWYDGSQYTAILELTNVSFVDTVIQISPLYKGIIDIVFSTTYGYVEMDVIIHSHSISYDDNTAVFSLFGAFALVLVLLYYHNSAPRTNKVDAGGPDIS